MKKTITLLSLIFLWAGVQAQEQNNIPQWYKDRHPERFSTVAPNAQTTIASFKTDATNSRLIGYNYENCTAGAWLDSDSSAMSYSGTRGGDWNGDYNPDLETSYNWNAGAWEGSSRSTYTYDANNNRLVRTNLTWVAGTWENNSKNTSTCLLYTSRCV